MRRKLKSREKNWVIPQTSEVDLWCVCRQWYGNVPTLCSLMVSKLADLMMEKLVGQVNKKTRYPMPTPTARRLPLLYYSATCLLFDTTNSTGICETLLISLTSFFLETVRRSKNGFRNFSPDRFKL